MILFWGAIGDLLPKKRPFQPQKSTEEGIEQVWLFKKTCFLLYESQRCPYFSPITSDSAPCSSADRHVRVSAGQAPSKWRGPPWFWMGEVALTEYQFSHMNVLVKHNSNHNPSKKSVSRQNDPSSPWRINKKAWLRNKN